MTFKAHFDGRVFVPESPVNLPVGEAVEVIVPPTPASEIGATPLQRLVAFLDQFPDDPDSDLPTDLAAQHDHYLYGTPKRP